MDKQVILSCKNKSIENFKLFKIIPVGEKFIIEYFNRIDNKYHKKTYIKTDTEIDAGNGFLHLSSIISCDHLKCEICRFAKEVKKTKPINYV